MNQPQKSSIIDAAKHRVMAMLDNFYESLDSEKEALYEETKNSAGDKYETQREMLQADIKRTEQQLDETKVYMEILENLHDNHDPIAIGTVAHIKQDSEDFWIFVGPAVGDLLVEGFKVKTVSSHSPIGKALIGKHKGENFQLNDKSFTVLNCY